ncbi:MAG: NACHT domain-containing protein [Steroidobacteraceae bacterium]
MLTEAAISGALKPLVEDLYSAARDELKRKIGAFRADAKLRNIAKAISSVQKVKPLWQIDREIKLMTFYYPSRLVVDGTPKEINSIEELSPNRNLIVQGTVGQGKSIFLRFLCIKELAACKRVPIFVEFRRYTADKPFRAFLETALAQYGFSSDSAVFDHLASNGKMVLLLDAFDELEEEAVTRVLTDLEALLQTFPQLQTVVTSRPDNGIERSPLFHVYRLAPLEPRDHRPFLEKIIGKDPARVDHLLTAIHRSSGDIRTLLTTPLLMTLLVLVHNATNEIPPSLPAFYEELFQTLLTKHDRTKAGFRRKRATNLTDYQLRKLFAAFCYASRQKNQLSFNTSVFNATAEIASKISSIQCDPGAFARDITQVACLMQFESLTYQFIHKSVAEFHAATYIADSPEDNARLFYEKVLMASKSLKWRQELIFLEQIDRYRFLKYYYVPAAQRLWTDLGVQPAQPPRLPLAMVLSIANKYHLSINTAPQPSQPPALGLTSHSFLDPYGTFGEHFYMEAASRLLNMLREVPTSELSPAYNMQPLGVLLEGLHLQAKAAAVITEAVKAAHDRAQRALAELERENAAREFMEP